MRGVKTRPTLGCHRLENRETPSAGSLDTTFGNAGKMIDTRLVGAAQSILLQPDGKVLAAGSSINDAGQTVATIARYNADGSPDSTFDSDGIQTVRFGEKSSRFASMSLSTDGKITLSGDDGKLSRIVRLNADGSLDQTFDSDGMVQSALSSTNGSFVALKNAMTTDGKTVAVGTWYGDAATPMVALTRYNANGSLDTTFGTNGVTLIATSGGAMTASSMAMQADGKIVVVGSQSKSSSTVLAIERFTADGKLDPTFDLDGRQTVTLGSNRFGVDLQLLSDGSIAVAGSGYELVKLKANGSLDFSFGSNGIARNSQNIGGQATSLALQADGRWMVGGTTTKGTNPENVALVRYGTTGQVDFTFGDRGTLVTDLGGKDRVTDILVPSDDRLIIAGGSTSSDSTSNYALAEFNTGYIRAATQTALTTSTTSTTFGQAITLSAKVTVEGDKKPSGFVSFFVGDTLLKKVAIGSNGVASFKTIALPGGTQTLKATYTGTAVQATSTSPEVEVRVARAQVNVVPGASPATAVYGQPVAIGARVTVQNSPAAHATGAVLIFDGNTVLGRAMVAKNGLAQITLNNLAPGKHAIRVIYEGDNNTIPAPSQTFNLTINRAPTLTSLAVIGDLSVAGQPLTLAVLVSAPQSTMSPAGKVVFRDGTKILGSAQLGTDGRAKLKLPQGLSIGQHSLTATYEGNGGYQQSKSEPAPIIFTV